MAKLVKGTHHVALKCAGLEQFEKTVGFYKNIIGLETVRTWGEGNSSGAMLNTGDSILEIFADAEGELPQGAIRHFAFATDNTDACIEAVRAAGYQVTMEPTDMVIEAKAPFPIRVGFCIGPVGEEIEFFQER